MTQFPEAAPLAPGGIIRQTLTMDQDHSALLRRRYLALNSAMDIELLQFRYSHFNEKARWALDFKGIAHHRTDLLPGPHRQAIRKLTGQTATPVLRIDREHIAGSARIIEQLERRFPNTPTLFPKDSEVRARALEFERHFDLVLGPAARICAFQTLLGLGSYVPRMFAEGKPWLMRTLYAGVFPLTRGLLRRANGMRDAFSIGLAARHVEETMTTLERLTKRSPYLAGDRFSVADLTAAALLAPLICPPHPDTDLPEPKPQALLAMRDSWRAHPAGRWALEIYAQHRPLVSSS